MRDRWIFVGYQPGCVYIYIYISTYLLILNFFSNNWFWHINPDHQKKKKPKNRTKNYWFFHENHQFFEVVQMTRTSDFLTFVLKN